MNIHNILTKIIPNINGELSCINSGGCGWFAHTLHTALAAEDIQSAIVLVQWSHYRSAEVQAMLTSLNTSDINKAYRTIFSGYYKRYINPCFGHLGVRVNGLIYDCNGVLNRIAISEPIDGDVLMLSLDGSSKTNPWNRTFLNSNSGEGDGAVYKMKAFIKCALSNLVSEVVS